jgi:hypothetical protein
MNNTQFKKYKKEFIQWYGSHDSHFYVTKAKTFSIESLNELRLGLKLLSKWFIERDITKSEQKHFKHFIMGTQTTLQPKNNYGFQIWDGKTQLYYTYLLETNNLISAANRPPEIFRLYQRVFRDISSGKSYNELESKYEHPVLNDISANARNFKNMFSKLGFAWMEHNEGVYITSTGERFIEDLPEDQIENKIREIMERQAIKWQLSNPTTPSRYEDLKIFPFIFILELLLKIEEEEKFITKLEYALIVSRAKSMDNLKNIYTRLKKFRSLTETQKNSLKQDVERIKREPRNLFEEINDSASKELSFFSSTLSCRHTRRDSEPCLYLFDEKQAKRTLHDIKANKITFIEFEREEDWFNYFGEYNYIPIRKIAVDYLLSTGKKDEAKRLVELEDLVPLKEQTREAIQEYHVEEFYSKHLNLIEQNLRVFEDEHGVKGRQYPTEVGRIDLLCLTPDGQFVVIEFKKDETSDKIIGQIFRYMGWVRINFSRNKLVRGIIVARDFDYKLQYAIQGTQYPKKQKIVKVIKHQFAVEEMTFDNI